MILRRASASDAPKLAGLRYEFRSGLSAPAESPDAFVARCAAWMGQQIASGGWHAWIAERDGDIVGQIWMHVIEKVPNPVGERDRHAYISNLYVRPDARGGTGTKLLELALAHAALEKVDRVVLWPTPDSRSLYLRYGFRAEGGVLERMCP